MLMSRDLIGNIAIRADLVDIKRQDMTCELVPGHCWPYLPEYDGSELETMHQP